MKPLIVANWKSNKTREEGGEWFKQFQISSVRQARDKSQISNKEIVVCPPFTLLDFLKSEIDKNGLPIRLGAQDISPYETGVFTGEIKGSQIKEFADYVIVGHSERRKNFGEDEEMIQKKVEAAVKYQLVPILCVSKMDQIISLKSQSASWRTNLKLIVAYEPLFAIGSGNPDTPENASNISAKIKEELGDVAVLYGGSVDSQNVNSFTKMPNINGVLVGNGSLDALEFVNIIKNA